MGLPKNTLHDKNEGAEGNVKCEQKNPKHVEKVYSRSRRCRKQMEHGYTVGLLKKSNITAHKEVSNVIDKRDEYSPEMKGSGLEKLTEMKEMDKVELPAQDPLQNNSLEMCDQTMEAKSQ